MILSEDEIKVLLNIINQLNFKLPDAKIVQGIVDKLQAEVKEPELKPGDQPTPDSPEVIEPAPVDVIPPN